VVLAATSAYAFSRWKFRMRAGAMVFLLTTQMIPAAMLLIPIYLLLARLQLTNTYTGLVLAYIVSSIPFSIWILKAVRHDPSIWRPPRSMARRAGNLHCMVPLSTPR
jgi:ABC-type maltose transport system permease subunit